MKLFSWEAKISSVLILSSAILYGMHYLFFRDLNHIFLWGFTNIAFVPINVFLVTVIINRLLIRREKKLRMEKLNMVIGAFFSEVGTDLLAKLSNWDPDLEKIKERLVVSGEWTLEEFERISVWLRKYKYNIDITKADLNDLRSFLSEHRDFLLRLLENPNLLEHESFTDLLRAVFHLTDELSQRKRLKSLIDADLNHLQGDIKRVYVKIIVGWLDYMEYLKDNYPFMLSLAMRTNPFDDDATPEVKG